MLAVSGAFRMRVVMLASSSTKSQSRWSTAGGREHRHDVGTHHSGHDNRSAPVVAGAAR